MSTEAMLAWGLTYLLHSTILIGAAWTATRCGLLRRLATREWCWRAALLGGVLSASLQTVGGVRPWMGSAPLPEQLGAAVTRTPAAPPEPRRAVSAHLPVASVRAIAGEAPAAPTSAPLPTPTHERDVTPALAMLLIGLLGIASGLRSQRALGRRRPVAEGPWQEALARLTRDAGVRRRVRLTVSDRLSAPVAFGVLRPEICLPARALSDLDPELARPTLAHELAHVVRLDPLWLGLAHVARTLLFVQPLNRLATRELTHLAELAADDWAARRSGDRFALARTLTEVASWLRRREPAAAACAMVRRRGRLEQRVRRILDATPELRRPRARFAALLLPILAPLALPALATEPPPAEPPGAWAAAAERAEALERQTGALLRSVLSLPAEREVERFELIERALHLRSQARRLRAVADAAALPEHP